MPEPRTFSCEQTAAWIAEDEADWAKTAATSPAFDFLKDAAEDIYTATDGKPFHDQG